MFNRSIILISLFILLALWVPAVKADSKSMAIEGVQLPGGTLPDDLIHSAFVQKRLLSEALDVPEAIVLREKDYTTHWLLPTRYFEGPHISGIISEMFPIRHAVNKDDAMGINISGKTWDVKILDGRSLEYLIKDSSLENKDVIYAFKYIFCQSNPGPDSSDLTGSRHGVLDHSDLESEFLKLNILTSVKVDFSIDYGTLSYSSDFDKGQCTWYRQADEFIFMFAKIKPVGDRIVPYSDGDKTLFIGGIPNSDSRPYLRFENSNRVQLSDEYFDKSQGLLVSPKPTDTAQPFEAKGLPIQP